MKIPDFQGDQAFAFLKAQTDFGPRNPNSGGHSKCLEYLISELGKSADRVSRQDFDYNGYNGELLKLTNLFAAFNSADTDRILLLAHWDTRPRADEEKDPVKQGRPIPGANDGASGVAVLLELARIMKQSPPPIGVDILFVDGEDYGKSHDLDQYFLGSKHFMSVKPSDYHPRFGVLLDMVGYRDLEIPMEQNSMTFAPAALELLWSTAEKLGVAQFLNVPGDEISDDHLALNKGGIPTVDVIDFQYPYWHTLEDTPDKCSGESLEAVGNVLAHVIYLPSSSGAR
jgi:glutaminyl-peptide cyclotransferase